MSGAEAGAPASAAGGGGDAGQSGAGEKPRPPRPEIREVVPKQGLLYSEKASLSEILCKPKIMPIKSVTLQKLEEMEREAAERASGSAQ